MNMHGINSDVKLVMSECFLLCFFVARNSYLVFFFSCLLKEYKSGPGSNIIDHKALVICVSQHPRYMILL
jgi:hypothetical protein